ncbi:MAG: YdeI/OmpD-associated family protein [Bacteroidota bacterium]|nr:YdeI/OmpD-associated family protein [Bacteroidota bacterium]MDP4232738.1 YdeI/OmpD-associated family protein [Bacteroidota bacterium]MDP4244054.1 YdeI/OmpD-associated family protein [Bacteroidota bacterium]MDP4287586.1 YdeI/OmpD-associated family protein [Bacteroidota bacterium]
MANQIAVWIIAVIKILHLNGQEGHVNERKQLLIRRVALIDRKEPFTVGDAGANKLISDRLSHCRIHAVWKNNTTKDYKPHRGSKQANGSHSVILSHSSHEEKLPPRKSPQEQAFEVDPDPHEDRLVNYRLLRLKLCPDNSAITSILGTKLYFCGVKKCFTAHLKTLEGNLGWRIVDVPFDVKKTFGKGGTVPVKGTVNGFAFRTSVFPRKGGKHFLLVNKQMQQGAGATEIGARMEVEMELDVTKRTVEIPAVLKKELEDDPELLEYLKSFSYSMRKYFADHVTQPKNAIVRQKRSREVAEVLLQMKEGEIETPPIIEVEFAHNPRARQGWGLMPVSQKRSHLWGIYYYKPGEARKRRIAKALEAMVGYAAKHQKPVGSE